MLRSFIMGLSVFSILLSTTLPVQAQNLCRQSLEQESSRAVVVSRPLVILENGERKEIESYKMDKDKAVMFVQEMMDKKLIFSTLQFISILAAHPGIFVGFHEISLADEIIAKGVSSYSQTVIRNNYKTKKASKGLEAIINPQVNFNETDQNYRQNWLERSLEIMEVLTQTLDLPREKRDQALAQIRSTLVFANSDKEILQALTELREMKINDPEKYEAFRQVWKSSASPAAKIALKYVNYDKSKDNQGIEALTLTGLATGLVISYLSGATSLEVYQIMPITAIAGFASAIPSALIVGIGDMRPISWFRSRMQAMTGAAMKSFVQMRVKKMARASLALSDQESQALIEQNSQLQRKELDQIQDLSRQSLSELLTEAESFVLRSENEIRKLQSLQMRIMQELSDQFSVLSERQEKLGQRSDEILSKIRDLKSISEVERRSFLKQIAQISAENADLNLDAQALEQLIQKASKQILNRTQEVHFILKQDSSKNLAEALSPAMEQLAMQSVVVDGMGAALGGLETSTRRTIESLNKLSMGIMAQQTGNLLENLNKN